MYLTLDASSTLKRTLLSFFFLTSFIAISANAVPTDTTTEADEPQIQEQLEQISSEENVEYAKWALETWNKLKPQTGKIQLLGGVATLDVPEDFYYLSADDSKIVLEEVWGNPPSSNEGLGMLFPKDTTPFDSQSWGVTIDYVEEGFVKDDDADDINYDDLLKGMKDDVAAASKQRQEQGYEAIKLVGWASPPYYDKQAKKLHWAKEFTFGDASENTLNYNIRVLGRRGYLLLNFIASINQLDAIKTQIPTVLSIAEFDDGHRYADFNPDIDHVAAYGIGALVAGKVLAKTGMIAAVLLALKKFWVLIFVGIGSLWKMLSRGRKNE